MTVFRQPVDQGCGRAGRFQKRLPLRKSEIGSNQRGFFLVSLVHQGKKQSDLHRLDLYISQFVDLKTIYGGKSFDDAGFGMIGD